MGESNPVGRPSGYDDKKLTEVTNYCLLGCTDEQLAKFLGIAVSTLYEWKKSFPEFSEAINKGKDVADIEVVKSLRQRALGYSHPETKVMQYEGRIIQVEVTKHHPPEVGAIKYWLNNRQKDKWRETQGVEISGPNGEPVQTVNYNLDNLSVEELEALEPIISKLANSRGGEDQADAKEADPLCGGDTSEI